MSNNAEYFILPTWSLSDYLVADPVTNRRLSITSFLSERVLDGNDTYTLQTEARASKQQTNQCWSIPTYWTTISSSRKGVCPQRKEAIAIASLYLRP